MKKVNNHYYDIGIDVTEFDRFKQLSDRFIRRFLTENEYSEFLKTDNIGKTKFLASRWALKEAVFKATSKKNPIPFTKIEFKKNNDGFVECTTFENVKVSLSYTKNYVYAIALWIVE